MSKKQNLKIGIIAPSGPVPQIELKLGAEKLRGEGHQVEVHPQTEEQHLFFAGTDEARANAFLEYAQRPDLDVLWFARGGYGANRLLPLLTEWARQNPLPQPKLLVGFSDATALMEFVRNEWNWFTVHGPMPGTMGFQCLSENEWNVLRAILQKQPLQDQWRSLSLEFSKDFPLSGVEGILVGGNLSVYCSLIGTPYMPPIQDKLIFFEDVGEPMGRIDRMAHQIFQSGVLSQAKAILLGEFEGCSDRTTDVLAEEPKTLGSSSHQSRSVFDGVPRKPLRPTYDQRRALQEIFGNLAEKYRIPWAQGLPIGHGENQLAIPLGARFRLGPSTGLELTSWGWRSA